MRYFANRFLPTVAVAMVLSGCNTFGPQPDPVPNSGTPSTVSTKAKVVPEQSEMSADQRLSINLQVFGLSYHPDREGSREAHMNNELNVGLGVTHRYHNDAQGVATLEAGVYDDSGSNWAYFAGAGYQYKLGAYWKFGVDLLYVNSLSYNYGKSFVAPIPRLTYDFGAAKLNAIYIPKIKDLNEFSVIAVYLTIPLWK